MIGVFFQNYRVDLLLENKVLHDLLKGLNLYALKLDGSPLLGSLRFKELMGYLVISIESLEGRLTLRKWELQLITQLLSPLLIQHSPPFLLEIEHHHLRRLTLEQSPCLLIFLLLQLHC
jgi:hypothetical protein